MAEAKRRKTKQPAVVGWREYVDFPEWNVAGIEAKIDTGARTSAIHVEDVAPKGGNRVLFHLITSNRKPFKHVKIVADLVRKSRVRSSTGHVQERYVVATTIRIGSIKRRVELSLVGRDKMLCRMLLGRRALAGWLVDPEKRHLHGTKKTGSVRRMPTA